MKMITGFVHFLWIGGGNNKGRRNLSEILIFRLVRSFFGSSVRSSVRLLVVVQVDDEALMFLLRVVSFAEADETKDRSRTLLLSGGSGTLLLSGSTKEEKNL